MSDKKTRIKRTLATDAARDSVKAADLYCRALVCRDIKKRTHRIATDKQVEQQTMEWKSTGAYSEFIADIILMLLRDIERDLGKQLKKCTLHERLNAYKTVKDILERFTKEISRARRGAPRKKIAGIIRNVQAAPAKEDRLRKKSAKEEWRKEVKYTVALVKGIKTRMYIAGFNSEDVNLDQALLQLIKDEQMPNQQLSGRVPYIYPYSDVMKQHLPDGFWDEYLSERGIPLTQKKRLKDAVSREKDKR